MNWRNGDTVCIILQMPGVNTKHSGTVIGVDRDARSIFVEFADYIICADMDTGDIRAGLGNERSGTVYSTSENETVSLFSVLTEDSKLFSCLPWKIQKAMTDKFSRPEPVNAFSGHDENGELIKAMQWTNDLEHIEDVVNWLWADPRVKSIGIYGDRAQILGFYFEDQLFTMGKGDWVVFSPRDRIWESMLHKDFTERVRSEL